MKIGRERGLPPQGIFVHNIIKRQHQKATNVAFLKLPNIGIYRTYSSSHDPIEF